MAEREGPRPPAPAGESTPPSAAPATAPRREGRGGRPPKRSSEWTRQPRRGETRESDGVRIPGKIKNWPEGKGFGFVRLNDGRELFCHHDALCPHLKDTTPARGLTVYASDISPGDKGKGEKTNKLECDQCVGASGATSSVSSIRGERSSNSTTAAPDAARRHREAAKEEDRLADAAWQDFMAATGASASVIEAIRYYLGFAPYELYVRDYGVDGNKLEKAFYQLTVTMNQFKDEIIKQPEILTLLTANFGALMKLRKSNPLLVGLDCAAIITLVKNLFKQPTVEPLPVSPVSRPTEPVRVVAPATPSAEPTPTAPAGQRPSSGQSPRTASGLEPAPVEVPTKQEPVPAKLALDGFRLGAEREEILQRAFAIHKESGGEPNVVKTKLLTDLLEGRRLLKPDDFTGGEPGFTKLYSDATDGLKKTLGDLIADLPDLVTRRVVNQIKNKVHNAARNQFIREVLIPYLALTTAERTPEVIAKLKTSNPPEDLGQWVKLVTRYPDFNLIPTAAKPEPVVSTPPLVESAKQAIALGETRVMSAVEPTPPAITQPPAPPRPARPVSPAVAKAQAVKVPDVKDFGLHKTEMAMPTARAESGERLVSTSAILSTELAVTAAEAKPDVQPPMPPTPSEWAAESVDSWVDSDMVASVETVPPATPDLAPLGPDASDKEKEERADAVKQKLREALGDDLYGSLIGIYGYGMISKYGEKIKEGKSTVEAAERMKSLIQYRINNSDQDTIPSQIELRAHESAIRAFLKNHPYFTGLTFETILALANNMEDPATRATVEKIKSDKIKEAAAKTALRQAVGENLFERLANYSSILTAYADAIKENKSPDKGLASIKYRIKYRIERNQQNDLPSLQDLETHADAIRDYLKNNPYMAGLEFEQITALFKTNEPTTTSTTEPPKVRLVHSAERSNSEPSAGPTETGPEKLPQKNKEELESHFQEIFGNDKYNILSMFELVGKAPTHLTSLFLYGNFINPELKELTKERLVPFLATDSDLTAYLIHYKKIQPNKLAEVLPTRAQWGKIQHCEVYSTRGNQPNDELDLLWYFINYVAEPRMKDEIIKEFNTRAPGLEDSALLVNYIAKELGVPSPFLEMTPEEFKMKKTLKKALELMAYEKDFTKGVTNDQALVHFIFYRDELGLSDAEVKNLWEKLKADGKVVKTGLFNNKWKLASALESYYA